MGHVSHHILSLSTRSGGAVPESIVFKIGLDGVWPRVWCCIPDRAERDVGSSLPGRVGLLPLAPPETKMVCAGLFGGIGFHRGRVALVPSQLRGLPPLYPIS